MELPGLVDDLAVVVWEGETRTRRLAYVSRHAERLLGHPVDSWLGDPGFWASVTHPEDRAESLRRRWDSTGDVEHDYRVLAADRRTVWLHETVHVANGRRRGVLVDISAYRASEERARFLGLLDRELQRLDDAEEIMAVATRLLGEHLHVDRCAYARAEADENHFVMSGDYATGLPPLPGRFAMAEFGGGALAAMRAGEPWVVTDSKTDPRLTNDQAAYEITGIRAVVCMPLLRAGRFVSAMAVHQATVRHWTPADIDLVSQVVNRCWESVQRVHADRALRDSEQRHRLLVERATDGIWMLDRELRFVEVNPAACTLLGYSRAELLEKDVADLVVPEHADRLGEVRASLSDERELTEVWDLRRSDGTVVALELSIQVTPTGVQAIGRDVTARRRADAERELLLQREHEIAEALQHSLLPRELPALERLATSARYLPASTHAQIGGDWYEVLPVAEGVVALTVGDVVGKGPTAAAVMGQLRSALAGYLLDGHSPSAALERLDGFAARINGAAGSTCACLTLDLRTGSLCWAAAGHPPPLVVHGTEARFLPGGPGAVLGAPGRAPYRDDHTTLAPGASVVLYTDGLVERRGAVIDEGLDRLLSLVRERSGLPPDALTDELTRTLLADGQDDDVALVVARYLPEPLRGRVPAEPAEVGRMRRRVTEWSAVAGLPTDFVYDLQLAVSEAAANVVDHAYPDGLGELEYEIAHTGSGVRVLVRDFGRWRPEPVDKGNRGRGLQLIRAVSSSVSLDRGSAGTTIEFVLAWAGSSTAVVATAPLAAEAMAEIDESGVDVQVLSLSGDLDLNTIDSLRGPLLGKVSGGEGRPVEIDLTSLAYLSSSGIALLLEAAATAARVGRRLTVTAAEGTAPARILGLSGLDGAPASTLTIRKTP